MNHCSLFAAALLLGLAASAPAQDDGGPWLPKAEQKKLLALMPKGVPLGKNLKFYYSAPVYQNMFTMNNGRSKFNVITPITDVDPWRVSGGMHHVDKKDWRNVTGLDLPGPIVYWQEDTDVRAFALVPKWRWQFPTGTLAYDVLLRVKDGKEHIFEVRVQEKRETDWDDGTIYRPKASTDKADRYSWTWDFSGSDLKGGSSITYQGKIDPKARFVPTRTLVTDGGNFTPPNYVGTGMSCNTCHSGVGELYDTPGRIYREARRGDDGRFSWHPFTDGGDIDERWPLKAK
ncbi:MAG: hypothetical protein EXR98_06580 [Gemmataceae bacterium]|nr:hypothetical protein [Gemmataceae bacterium]